MSNAENPRAVAGNNRPPPSSPFEAAQQDIADLYAEASLWLDGAPVTSQEQADGLSNLLRMIQAAADRADVARKAEKKPHDDAIAEIQGRYNPLIGDTKTVTGKAVLAETACRAALTAWQVKVLTEQKAAADEARSEAEHLTMLAREAMQSSPVTNLAERARAENLAKVAKTAEKAAARAGKARPVAGSIGRAVGLRTSYRGVIVEETAVAAHYWRTDRVSVVNFLQSLVDQDVRAGVRQIPGVRVDEVKQAV